jgi:hypothetical protein
MIQVGALGIQKHQHTCLISPTEEILRQCQSLFGPGKSEFEPHQVFIAIKVTQPGSGFQKELDFLFRTMQTRLCLPGVRDTEEGRFIRLAFAFSRRISLQEVQLPSTVENQGLIVGFRGVLSGTWEMKVHFPNPGHVETLLGNTAKLIQHVHYIDSAPPPPPKRI